VPSQSKTMSFIFSVMLYMDKVRKIKYKSILPGLQLVQDRLQRVIQRRTHAYLFTIGSIRKFNVMRMQQHTTQTQLFHRLVKGRVTVFLIAGQRMANMGAMHSSTVTMRSPPRNRFLRNGAFTVCLPPSHVPDTSAR